MKHLFTLLTATAISSAALMTPFTPSAEASTLPKAEANRSAIAIGFGPSVSFDAVIAPRLTLGGSLGLPFLVEGTNQVTGRYDVRLAYKFLQEGRLSVTGIVGVWGNANFDDFSRSRYAGLELGIGLAYRFNNKLTGRLNLVPGFTFPVRFNRVSDYYPPAGGFELAYRFSPSVEGTLGYNGQGDILGLRFLI